jgi:DNA-binding transcriptional LysR family regulator
MQDVNDLYFFARVAEHRGFTAAARKLHIAKSALSKRVARLEDRLGARLIERSSRGFRLTTVGAEIFAQCEGIVAAVEGTEAIAARAAAAPRGTVRFACPPGMAYDAVSSVLPDFLRAYPEIRVAMAVSNRRVDLVEDGFDLALRVRERLDTDATLVVRRLGISRRIFVASPGNLAGREPIVDLATLSRGPLLSIGEDIQEERWILGSEHGETELTVLPRLASSDFRVLLDAALAGVGVALLPQSVCRAALADGRLVHVLPQWHSRDSIVHLVFTTRRGLLPATRALIDYLSETLPKLLSTGEPQTSPGGPVVGRPG